MSRPTGEGKVRPLQVDADRCPTAYLLYNFDVELARLKRGHEDFLTDTVLHILETNAEHRVRLVGRASRSGPDRLNNRISRQRVEAVAAHLVAAGVNRSRIDTSFIGESAPFSSAHESEEDRSVEIHMIIAPVLNLVLEEGWRVRPTAAMVETIRAALDPLATLAGRQLQIHVGRGILARQADLLLSFDAGGRETRPCAGILILGNEGGGDIFVGAHESLRVCGGPRGDPRDPQGIDYVSQLEHVFENGEPEFAHFVANTCVHELGHVMAQLDHTSDPGNFMHSTPTLGANLPPDRRTRENMRRHWAGRKTFTPDQARALVCAIRTGNFPGGMRIQSGTRSRGHAGSR